MVAHTVFTIFRHLLISIRRSIILATLTGGSHFWTSRAWTRARGLLLPISRVTRTKNMLFPSKPVNPRDGRISPSSTLRFLTLSWKEIPITQVHFPTHSPLLRRWTLISLAAANRCDRVGSIYFIDLDATDLRCACALGEELIPSIFHRFLVFPCNDSTIACVQRWRH